MVTTVGTEDQVLDMLDNLLQLDLDARDGYDVVLTRVENEETRATLEDFKADHQRHAGTLAALISERGRQPTTGPGKGISGRDPFVLADLVGDVAILQALHDTETDTNAAYERAVRFDGLDEPVARALREGLEDERRHRAWIEETLSGR
jgi:rubrerythrin